jgi:hypothetical protein
VLPSKKCDGIVAFKGSRIMLIGSLMTTSTPKLPHALPFSGKEGPAMKRVLWDSEQPITIARVIKKGSITGKS